MIRASSCKGFRPKHQCAASTHSQACMCVPSVLLHVCLWADWIHNNEHKLFLTTNTLENWFNSSVSSATNFLGFTVFYTYTCDIDLLQPDQICLCLSTGRSWGSWSQRWRWGLWTTGENIVVSIRPTTHIGLTDRPKALFTYTDLFSSKGPRGLQGATGPPGKAGKRVTDIWLWSFSSRKQIDKQLGDLLVWFPQYLTSSYLLVFQGRNGADGARGIPGEAGPKVRNALLVLL